MFIEHFFIQNPIPTPAIKTTGITVARITMLVVLNEVSSLSVVVIIVDVVLDKVVVSNEIVVDCVIDVIWTDIGVAVNVVIWVGIVISGSSKWILIEENPSFI